MNVKFKADTKLPEYLPYPKFLLGTGLNLAAREVYALLLHRMTASQRNRWTVEEGDVFIIYPIAELAQDLGCSETTVKRALLNLSKKDLIERQRWIFNGANRIFLKMPTDQN